MPEKTKLEDYKNMNNTGFAFINLNEELKNEYITYYCINTSINFNNDIIIDEKLYNKIYDIYKSNKVLFLRVFFKFIDANVSDDSKFYKELINFKNAIIYKNDEEDKLYIKIYFGSIWDVDNVELNFNNNSFSYLEISLSKETLLLHMEIR